jgi:hypothetical protein
MSNSDSKTNRINLQRLIAFIFVLTLVTIALFSGQKPSSAALGKPEKQNMRIRMRTAEDKYARNAGMMSPMFAAISVDRTDDAVAAAACTAAANDCSLRGAVTFANLNPGTTINVPAGTYNLTTSGAGEGFSGNNLVGDLDITGNNTSIVGAGAASTVIHQTTAGDRVIEVNPNLDAAFITSISGVTISGGTENTGVGGGGIISGSINNVLTLTDCVISGNSATGAGSFGGGGVSHAGGSLTISGCTISGNSTSASGGGVGFSAGDPLGRFPSAGTLTVSGSTFSGNTATSTGGGAGLDLFDYNLSTSVYTLSTSTFSGNNATNGSGGAIIVESGGPLTVTTSSFAGNNAGVAGGAIFSSGTSVDVRYSRLSGNTASTGLTLFRGSGLFTADDNWWGVNAGPGANNFKGAGGVTITPAAWLQLQASASPSTICAGSSSAISADIKKRNTGADLTVELNGLPPFPATFTSTVPAVGNVSGASANFVNGAASATFNGVANGSGGVDVTADSQTVTAAVTVESNTTSDPADQAVCQGATATFSTTGGGPGPFHYSWTVDGSAFDGDNSSINVDTTGMSFGAHTVSVTTTGACGSASQSATLTVNSPTTTSDPVDQTVCEGATANFSTTAGGTGPFHYAWTVDGSASGGDSATLNVNTTGFTAGNHTVSVTTTGACGSASQSATLTVQATTTTTDPADQTVCAGATASFSTTAGGTGPFSYSWTVDGNPAGTNSPSLNVDTTGLSAGPHTVSVTTTGTCGSASQSATLTVQATTTTTDPADQTVCQGATASFSTTAGGTGPFHYSWTVDGNAAGGDSASLNVSTGSLSVGNHTVSVTTTGTCGSASQSATLTVNANTTTTDPADQSVCEGATANFSTTAGGTGPFSYAWTVDGNPAGGNSPNLSVNTTGFSQGTHTVTVTTTGACGSASQSANLNVNNSAPTITVANSAISIWPPNHQYQNFTLADFGVTANSACEGDLTSSVVIVSVTSDEVDNGGGADGNTVNDIVIANDCKSVQLRRERDGDLDGRVYTVTFAVTDSLGHTATATAQVTVPLDQSGGGAINSGVHNTVNGTCP